MIAYFTSHVGFNKGQPRIWVEGQNLVRGNFEPGAGYNVQFDEAHKTIYLRLSNNGKRVVSQKKTKSGVKPVVDLNNSVIGKVFGRIKKLSIIVAAGLITIAPHATATAQEERLARMEKVISGEEPLSIGEAGHGLGVLGHAVHSAFLDEGYSPRLEFALDCNQTLLDAAAKNNSSWNDNTLALVTNIEDTDLSLVPKVDLLVSGIPCSGASVAGRSKNRLTKAEDHSTAGSFFHYFLQLVDRCSPSQILMECVVPFRNTGSYAVLKRELQRKGYHMHELVLAGEDFDSLENRKRFFSVAVTEGLNFSGSIQSISGTGIVVSDILDKSVSEGQWRQMAYLDRKDEADRAQGKGFRLQLVDETATAVTTLGAGYHKSRSNESILMKSDGSGLRRLFTPAEHARIKGAPMELIAGLSNVHAHTGLGQSGVYGMFKAVAKSMAADMKCSRQDCLGKGLALFDAAVQE